MALTDEQRKAMFANLKSQDFKTLSIRLLAKDIDPELRMKINEELRARELKEQKENVPTERERVEFKQPELTKNAVDFIGSGEYMGGIAWADYERVTIDGKTFDTKTLYDWEDPDFPDTEQFDKALEEAKKVNPNKPEPADFLDWTESIYRFKLDKIRISADGDVDGFPKDTPLGRIDVKSLEVVS